MALAGDGLATIAAAMGAVAAAGGRGAQEAMSQTMNAVKYDDRRDAFPRSTSSRRRTSRFRRRSPLVMREGQGPDTLTVTVTSSPQAPWLCRSWISPRSHGTTVRPRPRPRSTSNMGLGVTVETDATTLSRCNRLSCRAEDSSFQMEPCTRMGATAGRQAEAGGGALSSFHHPGALLRAQRQARSGSNRLGDRARRGSRPRPPCPCACASAIGTRLPLPPVPEGGDPPHHRGQPAGESRRATALPPARE